MTFMRPCLGAVLLLNSAAPMLMGQRFTVGIGYGAQSSSPHPRTLVAQGAVGIDADSQTDWSLAPTLAMAMLDGRTGWRAHLALEGRLHWAPLVPYFGGGPSWTSEIEPTDWSGSEFGMVLLAGLDVPLKQLTSGGLSLAAFVELDTYTYGYAKGHVLAGV
jgi:hypothetical protein